MLLASCQARHTQLHAAWQSIPSPHASAQLAQLALLAYLALSQPPKSQLVGNTSTAARCRFWTQLFLGQTVASPTWGPKKPKIAIDSEGLISQHFNAFANFVQDPNTRYVYQVTSEGKHYTKHEVCFLQAPGGKINYVPMFDKLYPRWKHGRHHLFRSGEQGILPPPAVPRPTS